MGKGVGGKGVCVCMRVCATGGISLVLQPEPIHHCLWGRWNLLWGEYVGVCVGEGGREGVCV